MLDAAELRQGYAVRRSTGFSLVSLALPLYLSLSDLTLVSHFSAAGNGGGVGVSQGRPGSGAGPAKSWRAADFDNTGTSTASTAGFKTPRWASGELFPNPNLNTVAFSYCYVLAKSS
jgi:hypothetical protein